MPMYEQKENGVIENMQEEAEKTLELEMPKSLGNKIKFFREQRKITQSELAEKLSVTRQAISNWERDKTLPDVYTLQKIASFFERTLDEFMEGIKEVEITMPKTPGYLAAATGGVIVLYLVIGGITSHLHVETVASMVVLWVFCQLFLHLIFGNIVKTGNISALAGYNSKVEYRINEVKKALIQMDIHIAVSSFGTVLLLGSSSFLERNAKDILFEILIFAYVIDLTTAILLYNYRSLDRTLVKEHDRKTAKAGMVSSVWLVVWVFIFCGATIGKFTISSIENNSGRAVEYLGFMLLFLLVTIPEFFYEQRRAKKKIEETGSYRPGAAFWVSTALALAVTAFMFLAL